MTALQIYPLSEKPEFAETCAAWSFGEWGCYVEGSSLEKTLQAYKKRASKDESIPRTWVGMIGSKMVATTSIVECDHNDHKDLTPWLASVFVHPEFRGKGYASALIKNTHNEVKKMGVEKFYLFTPDAAELYAKHGWTEIGQVRDPRGLRDSETLMEIEL